MLLNRLSNSRASTSCGYMAYHQPTQRARVLRYDYARAVIDVNLAGYSPDLSAFRPEQREIMKMMPYSIFSPRRIDAQSISPRRNAITINVTMFAGAVRHGFSAYGRWTFFAARAHYCPDCGRRFCTSGQITRENGGLKCRQADRARCTVTLVGFIRSALFPRQPIGPLAYLPACPRRDFGHCGVYRDTKTDVGKFGCFFAVPRSSSFGSREFATNCIVGESSKKSRSGRSRLRLLKAPPRIVALCNKELSRPLRSYQIIA